MNHAIFLDRDGTINEDPGYLNNPNLIKLFPGVGEALYKLKKQYNFLLIVISNQSGIARGFITKEQVEAVNEEINNILITNYSVKVDRFYYCPYHPDYSTPEECSCRKPSPQMIFEAQNEFNIDLSKSYLIGDSYTDILCGINAGVKSILVKTGYGSEHISILEKENILFNFTAKNFEEAANFVINDFIGEIKIAH